MKISKATTLFHRHGMPVILQELEDDHYAKYCIQFRGGGQYFRTIEDAVQYINSRWQKRKGFIPKCDDPTQKWSSDELLQLLRSETCEKNR